MNVLLLTPDRVGSTLLQRVLTVYMLRKGFDKPVINLHELSNKITPYYNTTLNQMVLGKEIFDYSQSLGEVEELLSTHDHYVTSRLAHYHLLKRNDSMVEQAKFYEYLNKNFYIISCRRKNLFEHGLSWVIKAHSKHLNVYSYDEKIDIFADIYKRGIVATKEEMFSKLDAYKNYTQWVSRYFDVQSYFNYEDSITNLEDYVLNLDFMAETKENSWQDMFGQTFDQFNACHKNLPDLMLLPSDGNSEFTPLSALTEESWDKMKGIDWPEYNTVTDPKDVNEVAISDDIKLRSNVDTVSVSKDKADFIKKHAIQYKNTANTLSKLVEDGFLTTTVPIKLQTLKEKKLLIKNYDDCIKWYNEWVELNNYGEPFTEEQYTEQTALEESNINNFTPLSMPSKL